MATAKKALPKGTYLPKPWPSGEKTDEKIYVVLIETEDTEKYYFAFKTKPTVKVIKKIFFEETGDTYDISDWGICISYKIIKLNILE